MNKGLTWFVCTHTSVWCKQKQFLNFFNQSNGPSKKCQTGYFKSYGELP